MPITAEGRILAAIDDAIARMGCRPAYVHVAYDVYRQLEREAFEKERWRGRPIIHGPWRLVCAEVPVRASDRLVSGSVVPVLPSTAAT